MGKTTLTLDLTDDGVMVNRIGTQEELTQLISKAMMLDEDLKKIVIASLLECEYYTDEERQRIRLQRVNFKGGKNYS